jgi:aarF domain-containing kinase
MAGRRLVDAAKLFNASKSVAQKHIALRSKQWDAYNKTSTLAKAVKNQTDRVTLTAAAAIALSQRFSDEAPAYARAAADRATNTQWTHQANIPRRETVQTEAPVNGAKEGLEQDHHYDRSGRNTVKTPPPTGELEVEQKKAHRSPLPDGTIPSQGLTLEQEEKGQDTFSERPVHEAPKEPLAQDQGEQVQHEEEGIKPVESTESTIPLPGQPEGASTQSTEAIPAHANDPQQPLLSPQTEKLQKGHDRDVFYSRSVESHPTASSQPQLQIPTVAGTKQKGDEHVKDASLNQDVFYNTPKPGQDQVEDDVPEGINTDVFHSRKVARMLGSDSHSRKEAAERKTSGKHPLDDRSVPSRHPLDDRPLSSIQSQTKPSAPSISVQEAQPATTSKEMEDLASQLAQDVQSNADGASEVRLLNQYDEAC